MIYLSTGLRNQLLGNASLKKALKGMVLKVYSGAVPADADAAAGTMLAKFTNLGASVKAKQKIRITPTAGTQANSSWNVWLNGVKVTFVDDGTPTAAEICTGLYNALGLINGTAVTTPACTINISDTYGLFAFTNNGTTLDIEAASAGVSFTYDTSVTGGTGSGGALAMSVITADAYCLEFENYADMASGIVEKLSTQTWQTTVSASGTAQYFRLQLDSDDDSSSTSYPRIQGSVNTANADLNMSSVTFTAGAPQVISSFQLTLPASKTSA